ncbi:MAG: fasciclin domain-containing protein [Kofleriaceae bacterium]
MKLTALLLPAALSLAVVGCKKKDEAAPPAPKPEPSAGSGSAAPAPTPTPTPPVAAKNLVEVAREAGSFGTLVKAIEAADLVATLSGPGPFTVFAPTDEAFAKLPPADFEALLGDKAKLAAVLTYHVVPGKVMAADVGGMTAAKSVQGGELAIDAKDGVKIGGATVTKTDIEASNGVIHVIDTVLMPPA